MSWRIYTPKSTLLPGLQTLVCSSCTISSGAANFPLRRRQHFGPCSARIGSHCRSPWTLARQAYQHRRLCSIPSTSLAPVSTSAPQNAAQCSKLSPLQELVFEHHARLTYAVQQAWLQVLLSGDTAVDATCGNGHDTLALARAVGPSGRVFGFDIQEDAIRATQQRLQDELSTDASPELHLVHTCHSRLQEVVGSSKAKVVAFNCGYLPRGDKTKITTAATTLAAIEAALEVVCPGGLISILAYTKHPGGHQEYEAVCAMLAKLPPTYWTSTELRLVNRPTAPIMLLIWRNADQIGSVG